MRSPADGVTCMGMRGAPWPVSSRTNAAQSCRAGVVSAPIGTSNGSPVSCSRQARRIRSPLSVGRDSQFPLGQLLYADAEFSQLLRDRWCVIAEANLAVVVEFHHCVVQRGQQIGDVGHALAVASPLLAELVAPFGEVARRARFGRRWSSWRASWAAVDLTTILTTGLVTNPELATSES